MQRLPLKGLLHKFIQREITCVEYARRVIDRMEEFKDHNLYTYFDEEEFLERAKESGKRYANGTARPLEGIPIAFKDNIDIEGEPNSGGTPAFWNRFPRRTSTLAQILFDNGAIKAGRTVMHELAFGITSNNSFTGAAGNPHNIEYSCGGSSGGSGAVVGGDIVPCAIGTDTGGSIRIPSSNCGVFGYKPSIGRWPTDYGLKMTHMRDTIGPMVRNADDLAILDEVVTRQKPLEPPLPKDIRIGIPRQHFWDNLDPEIEKAAEDFLKRLSDAGYQIIDNGDHVDKVADLTSGTTLVTINFEVLRRLEEYIHNNNYKDLYVLKVLEQVKSSDVAALLSDVFKNPTSPEEWERVVLGNRVQLRKNFGGYFHRTKADVIMFPTTKLPAQKIGVDDTVRHNGVEESVLGLFIHNTDPGSFVNYPGLTMPLGKTADGGVPFGMEIDTYTYNDRKLIAIARTLQKHLDKLF